MSSSLRRGTLAATTLALSVATLSACAAGDDAQTLEIKPDNAAATVGDVKIQNVNILTAPSGSGPAAVTARIFNNGSKAETLRAITVKGAGERVKISPAPGKKALTVPAGGWLALGGKGNASAVLPDISAVSVKDGNAQPVSFDLSRTGTVRLRATVVPAKGEFKKFGPSVQPSPSAPSGTPSGSPSGSPSSSASATPSDQASDSGKGPDDATQRAGRKTPSGSASAPAAE